jgi:two-component system OmpR family sensor kinase
LQYADTKDELREAVRTASDETDRVIQLAGDLLLIASADHSQLALRRESLPARDLLESVRSRFAWRAEADGRPLAEVDAPAGLVLAGDRLRLEQALGNLVDNALRHGEGTVRIEARAADGRVEIHVRDQGPGFPADFLARAFHRFSRGDASHTGAGTGLGLAIVEAIAHAHHGTANAANGPHGGADVSITLPRRS